MRPFKYEMIDTKEEIYYVLCVNDYKLVVHVESYLTTYKIRYFLLLKYAIIQQRFILYQQTMFSFHRSYFEIDFG